VKNGLELSDRNFKLTQLLLLIDTAGFNLLDAVLDSVHLDLHLWVRGIVERPAGYSIKIDEAGYLIRKATPD
jgi:hypothetical protein